MFSKKDIDALAKLLIDTAKESGISESAKLKGKVIEEVIKNGKSEILNAFKSKEFNDLLSNSKGTVSEAFTKAEGILNEIMDSISEKAEETPTPEVNVGKKDFATFTSDMRVTFVMAVPGYTKEDIVVKFADKILTVSSTGGQKFMQYIDFMNKSGRVSRNNSINTQPFEMKFSIAQPVLGIKYSIDNGFMSIDISYNPEGQADFIKYVD